MQLVIFLTKGLLQAPLHPVPSAASGLPGQSGVDRCLGALECWLEGRLQRSGGTAGWQAVESAIGQQVRKESCSPPQSSGFLLPWESKPGKGEACVVVLRRACKCYHLPVVLYQVWMQDD